jgi:putative ABC transport system ATP-binding protein
MSEPADLLHIRDLRFAWPGASADVLHLPALHLRAGRSYFLHGPSGCGKSTLLGLMAGVLLPRQGRVELLGQDWAALPAGQRDRRRAQHVGVIFQQFNLLSYLSCLDNVLRPCVPPAAPARRWTMHAACCSAWNCPGSCGSGRRARCPSASSSAWPQPAR